MRRIYEWMITHNVINNFRINSMSNEMSSVHTRSTYFCYGRYGLWAKSFIYLAMDLVECYENLWSRSFGISLIKHIKSPARNMRKLLLVYVMRRETLINAFHYYYYKVITLLFVCCWKRSHLFLLLNKIKISFIRISVWKMMFEFE